MKRGLGYQVTCFRSRVRAPVKFEGYVMVRPAAISHRTARIASADARRRHWRVSHVQSYRNVYRHHVAYVIGRNMGRKWA